MAMRRFTRKFGMSLASLLLATTTHAADLYEIWVAQPYNPASMLTVHEYGGAGRWFDLQIVDADALGYPYCCQQANQHMYIDRAHLYAATRSPIVGDVGTITQAIRAGEVTISGPLADGSSLVFDSNGNVVGIVNDPHGGLTLDQAMSLAGGVVSGMTNDGDMSVTSDGMASAIGDTYGDAPGTEAIGPY